MNQTIQIKRGLSVNRTLVTPAVGELLLCTDTNELYVGDGVTPGGKLVSGGSSGGGGGYTVPIKPFSARLGSPFSTTTVGSYVDVTGLSFVVVPDSDSVLNVAAYGVATITAAPNVLYLKAAVFENGSLIYDVIGSSYVGATSANVNLSAEGMTGTLLAGHTYTVEAQIYQSSAGTITVSGGGFSGITGLLIPQQTLQPDMTKVGLLYKECVVQGTAQTSIPFTDLDIVRDGGYVLEWLVVNPTANAANLYVYANSDQNNANYVCQRVYGQNGAAGASTSAEPIFGRASGNGGVSFGTAEMFLVGGIFGVTSDGSRSTTVELNTVQRNGNLSNVSRLDIVSSVAGGFGAGSRFRLYRRLPRIIPDVTPQESNMLVQEVVVSGSAETQLDIPGLDGNADGGYEVEVCHINTTAGSVTAHLYVNGDLTATNYTNEYLSGSGTTTNAGGGDGCPLTNAPAAGWAVSVAKVSVGVDGRYSVSAQENRSGGILAMRTGYKEATISNITSLHLVASAAGGLGVGTRIRVYRKNVPVYLINPSNEPEYGSNANGEYMKHPNGVLECWGIKDIGTIACTSVLGGWYESAVQTITFPLAFVDTPVVTIAPAKGYGSTMLIGEIGNATTTGKSFTVLRPVSTASLSPDIGWRAIGRWK